MSDPPRVRVQLQPEDGTAARSSENHPQYGWANTEVRLRFKGVGVPDVVLAAGPPDARGLITSVGSSVAATTVEVDSVRRYGPHRHPFVEALSEVEVPAGAPLTLQPRERRRISAWANPNLFVDDRELKVKPHLDLVDGLDDISLVSTVFIGDDGRVDWARDYPGDVTTGQPRRVRNNYAAKHLPKNHGLSRAEVMDRALTHLTRKIITHFHARGVQVFAGFYVDTGNTKPNTKEMTVTTRLHSQRLIRFLRGRASMQAFAADLNKFFDDRKLDVDGIWFDLEVASLTEHDRARVEEMLIAVADAFGRRGRCVAFAAAADEAPLANPPNMRRHFFSHPADLGVYPNVLVRPMSYNLATDTKAVANKRRLDVLARLLDFYRLHPAQVQIGVGRSDSRSTDGLREILVETAQLLRPHRVGMIHWNLQNSADAETYLKCDRHLNGDGTRVFVTRPAFGQPIQGPIDEHRATAMNRSLPSVQPIVIVEDPA